MKKPLLIVILLGIGTILTQSDTLANLDLAWLKDNHMKLGEWVNSRPAASLLLFFSVYVLMTALSVPGAVFMTLAGGALFGLAVGTLLSLSAATLGATLAFLIARYLLHDWVVKRFGARLDTLNAGIEKDGAYYLFSLRLIPVFPFFLINIAMAMTPIKARTFFWVSFVGMAAGTAVYVNAGTQLAKLQAVSDILSPALLLSFVLLGLLPWLAKKLIQLINRYR